MTRSEVAFRFSGKKFFQETDLVYFWTFTVNDVYPDWCYSRIWSRFIRDMSDLYGGTLAGLKVVELHKEHGIHWHCLLNKRVWVGQVRRIGKKYGIGRVHVKQADRGAIDYLAKYVRKQFTRDHKLFARCSRWGTVGAFVGVKVKNIEIDSKLHRAIRFCQERMGRKKLPFIFIAALIAWDNYDDASLARACAVYMVTGSISGLWLPEDRRPVGVTNGNS